MGYPMAMKSCMCSRTRENNENKVGPILWDTLYNGITNYNTCYILLFGEHRPITKGVCGVLSPHSSFGNFPSLPYHSICKIWILALILMNLAV